MSRQKMLEISRRGFLVGCSASVAAMAGARFGLTAFAEPQAGANKDILVIVFLRGGCDALNLVPPLAGADRTLYEDARPVLQVPASGAGSALSLDGQLGLHPSAATLHALYQAGKLAVIVAAGMHADTRSHFDAMLYMELGTPNNKHSSTGWLTRHLQSAPQLPEEIILPALAMGSIQPTSLLGSWEAVAMSSTSSFNLNTGPYRWRDAQRHALRQIYEGGSTSLHGSGTQALNAVDIVEASDAGSYEPGNGAVYPNSSFGNHLKVVAQMIKLEMGLRVATIDLGGWDTHRSQGNGSGGYFATKVADLSDGLAALYTDLAGTGDDDYAQRLTMVVMSEFGRRLRQNDNDGSDHGHGGVMLALGRKVNGGLYGQWPGLENEDLYDGADLAVTTDYRRILSEILIRRLENPNLGIVFPGYREYDPLGIVQGTDLEPVYGASYSAYLPYTVR